MAYLDVRTMLPVVEQALWDTLSLGYQERLSAVADIAALRAASVVTVPDRALRYVTAASALYRWSDVSTAADDGAATIAPTTPKKTGLLNGRWLRVTTAGYFGPNSNAPLATRQGGYARSVILHQGAGAGAGGNSAKEAAEAVFGRSPAILIEFLGDDPEPASLRPGAFYRSTLEFRIMCYSESLRGRPHGLLGSDIAAEAARDPGLLRMLGDVRYLLAGVDLGLSPGVERVEIGRSDIFDSDHDQRVFIGGVQVTVRASYTIPDEDLETMRIQVSPKWTDHPSDETFDRLNYVASGLRIPIGSNLTVTPEAGTVFIAGVALATSPGSVTLGANKDTYRDVTAAGTWTYSAVDVGDPAPAIPSGAMRIAVTTTNGSAVTDDRFLCSVSYPLWTPAGSMTIS